MKVLKRFHYTELYTDNNSICNPCILDGKLIYRDSRHDAVHIKKPDNTKILKICDIDKNFKCSNFETIYNTQDNTALSDAIWFQHKDKKYIRVTKVDESEMPNDYSCKLDLLDISTKQLLNLQYDLAAKKEKNWVFISYKDDVYISYGYIDDGHVLLKCDLDSKKISFFRKTEFNNKWPKNLGWVKNTSNFINYNNYMWSLIHSHNFPKPGFQYNMGIALLSTKPPFRVLFTSKVPLFKMEPGEIIFPTYLNFKEDKMHIGVSLSNPHYMDIIELDQDDINLHFSKNKSFDYPTDKPKV